MNNRPEEAIGIITALSPLSRVTRDAARALAMAQMDMGRLEAAEQILERLLSTRLLAYETTGQALDARATEVQDKAVRDARAGRLPLDLEMRMTGPTKSSR
ncbi:MAG: hypothetical protein ACE366_14870 [Bradymonadia bacterium]